MARLIPAPIYDRDHNSPPWVAWFRSVSNLVETVGTKGIQHVENGDTLNLTEAGQAVLITAATSDTYVVLPSAKRENVGETVTVFIDDATFNGVVSTKAGQTVVGDTSVIYNEQYMSLTFMVISPDTWTIV